jgi:hypothetical protein
MIQRLIEYSSFFSVKATRNGEFHWRDRDQVSIVSRDCCVCCLLFGTSTPVVVVLSICTSRTKNVVPVVFTHPLLPLLLLFLIAERHWVIRPCSALHLAKTVVYVYVHVVCCAGLCSPRCAVRTHTRMY